MKRLFVVYICAVLAAVTAQLAAPADPKGTVTLPPSDISGPVQTAPNLTMVGEPDVSNWSPKDYAVQGQLLSFFGTLAPRDFHAQAGSPPVDLPIVESSPGASPATFIRVRVPDTLESSGAPLVVWYSGNGSILGPKRTLSPSFNVLRKARVVSFRVVNDPTIVFTSDGKRPTKIEVGLADYDPSVETLFGPPLRAPGCPPNGDVAIQNGAVPTKSKATKPYTLSYDFFFHGVELSGRHCSMEIYPYESNQPPVAAGVVNLPPLSTYTISNTADLLKVTSPSGKKVSATASKGIQPCQLASVGTAGSFATGAVTEDGDLSFQLRNGLLREDCEFQTSTGLQLKDGWFLKTVDWQFTHDSLCTASEFGIQYSSGATVSFFKDSSAIFQVRFQATCMPSSDDAVKNNHLYKARLASVQVIGPAGESWQDAFK